MLSSEEQLLRCARRRDFSGDSEHLEKMFRVLHAEVVRLVSHLQSHWHDTQSRWELRRVFDLRAGCFAALGASSFAAAMRLAAEFNLVIPSETDHAAMVG